MLSIYILLGGIILVMSLFSLPVIISDARQRRHKS